MKTPWMRSGRQDPAVSPARRFVFGYAVMLALAVGSETSLCAGLESAAQTQQDTIDLSAGLPALQELATAQHPGVRAAREFWRAAEQRARGEGFLPDPRLSSRAVFMDGAATSSPQAFRLGIEQTLPWFGVRSGRNRAAWSRAEAARARYDDAQLQLHYDVARAYHELHWLAGSIEITADNLELLRQFEEISLVRYRVGTVENADLLRLQVEMGKLEDQLRRLRDLVRPARARMQALLGHSAPIRWTARPVLATPPPLSPVDSLRQQMLGTHPRLRSFDAEAASEEQLGNVARREGYPDVTVGVMRTFVREGASMEAERMMVEETMATLALNLPLWRGKYRARVAAAEGRRAGVLAQRSEAIDQLLVEFEEALYEHEDASRRLELYRDTLLPTAEQSLRASLRAYEVGRSDFTALIDTERTLLEFRLSLLRAEVDLTNARARIARLVPAEQEHSNTEVDR